MYVKSYQTLTELIICMYMYIQNLFNVQINRSVTFHIAKLQHHIHSTE